MNLGSILLASGNVHEAAQTYKEVTQLAPKDATAHYLLSQTLEKSGDLDKAKAELIMFLELAPPDDPRKEKAREHLNHL
jgi:Flp pilus assembly protein TadD